MKILLAISAIFEGIVGIGLLIIPVLVVSNFLNTPLETPGGLFAARLCGAAIITLAICCWKARGVEIATDAMGVVTAMLFYNFAAAAVLVYAGVRLGLQSPLIWPAIVAHAVLGFWCAALVWRQSRRIKRTK
jgi:small basic protein